MQKDYSAQGQQTVKPKCKSLNHHSIAQRWLYRSWLQELGTVKGRQNYKENGAFVTGKVAIKSQDFRS